MVATYVYTVNYVQKMAGFPDIGNNFVAKKMLQGLRKLTARADTKLPITPSILKALIQSLDHFGFSSFIKTLLKAMYLLAFHVQHLFCNKIVTYVWETSHFLHIINCVNISCYHIVRHILL
jgi:hypothetical protein